MKLFGTTLLFLALGLGAAQLSSRTAGQTSSPADTRASAADSLDRKLARIQSNGARPKPDQTPTVLTEEEANAYFATGRVRLPAGVKEVKFAAEPGVISATSRIDFDQLTAAKRSANPLLSLFTGVHDVRVVAQAEGSGGIANIRTQSVELDGVTVPRVALEFFIDRYLKPKYPYIGLDTRFRLPARIDMAVVGTHQVTVTQK
jgi:hypothetical protein